MPGVRGLCMLLSLWILACTLSNINGDLVSDIHAIQDDFWSWRMKEVPEFATFVGVNDYNDALECYSITEPPVRKHYADGLLQRLKTIKANSQFGQMTKANKVNYEVLRDIIETYVNGYGHYTAYNPVNFLEGPQIDVGSRFDNTPFKVHKDFHHFLARMTFQANQIDEMISLMRYAIFTHHTNYNVSMLPVPGQIDNIISGGAQGTLWYILFAEKVDNFNGSEISLTHRSSMKQSALAIISDYLIPAYQRLKTFITSEYLPHTRTGYGVDSWPEGNDLYPRCLKWHLSVDMSPDQVHQKGLQEVERIKKKMKSIMDRQNFTGSVQEYFTMLSNQSKFHMSTKDALITEYKNIINNRITPKLPQLFKDIPDIPVTVQPMPFDGPFGMYVDASADGSRPGIFLVNLNEPQKMNTFSMMALTLHETVPGHHMQTIYSHNSSLPDFRMNVEYGKMYKVPFHFPFYTAYTEGWAMYAESLGEELNLYKDDFELMGRYSEDIFRTCSLVVDTGLHSKGWTRDQAVDYLLQHVSNSRDLVEIEIDRYITWPGQACAHKIGEFKIRELREKATQRLGSHFDIREFHSLVLSSGALPLNVLEEVVDDWLTEQIKLIPTNPIG